MDFQNYGPNKKCHAFEEVSNNIIDIILSLIKKPKLNSPIQT